MFIGLAIGPLLIVGVVLAWQSFSNQREQALSLQHEVSQRVAVEVTSFFDELENQINIVTQVQGLQRLDQDRQQSVLSELLLYQNLFEELILVDDQGQEQIHLSRSNLSPSEPQNFSESEAFLIPQATGEIYYSPIRFDESTGEPLITISAPLLDVRSGTVSGVLVTEVRVKKIWELIQDIKVNEGQSVYIVDADNRVVAHRNPSIVLRGTNFDAPEENGLFPGLTGENALLAQESVHFGEQTFRIIAEQTVSEALASAFNSVYLITAVIILTLVVASTLGLLMVRQIVQPIQKMATTAQAISDGDLSQQVEVTSQDELGVLSNAFNSMTAQLHNLINSLEARIADRTQRLEIVATLGEHLNAILDPNDLLREVVNQIKENFDYYHAHIYLLDDSGKKLTIMAGTGEAGAAMIANNHQISTDDKGLVTEAVHSKRIVIVDNVQDAEEWLANPLLPETQSEMAVPIIHKDDVIGVLDVQEDKIGGLDESDANLLRSLANQVAVALTNAQLFAQTTEAKEVAEQAKQEIEVANKALEGQIWLTTGQAQLNEKMQGQQDITMLATSILKLLCPYMNAQIGALYVVAEQSLHLVGSYAFNHQNGVSDFGFGEGLVGQAVIEKEPMIITDIPQNYMTIRSGLGETVPNTLMVLPFMYEDRVIGVIEMGTLAEFSDTEMDFMRTALSSIALAFNTAQARARIDELLIETQQQAEELQAQGEELRVTNEELETQTESLKASEARLREKQTELEETNTQLEEKAAALEESGITLREKQAALDKQNQDLKEAQQELKIQAEELALASKYKSEFLANMSHELRTPLNSLLILARMLAENKENNLTEDQIESAQIIYSGGTDLLNLINDILDLSKIESGKMEFTYEPMRLVELETDVRYHFSHVAAEKGLELKIELADDLPNEIQTDVQRLKQVLKNLLSNAFKFTNKGSVTLSIYRPDAEANLSRSGLDYTQAVAINVTDTGIGMTAEQQKIIFEAFQQADGSTNRQFGGTGLGLSISREFATKLGGQINVKSEPKKGSTFTLYLPIEKVNTPEPDKETIAESTTIDTTEESIVFDNALITPPQATDPKPASSIKAIKTIDLAPFMADDRDSINGEDKILLVIEDDPTFAKIVYDYSHQKGFKCLATNKGRAGLELVKTYQPEAIILDLQLPDISGWEVLETLKNDPALRHIPVHIMSVDDETIDAFRKGAVGYLTKPVSSEGLDSSFQKIEQLISEKIKALLLVEDDAKARRTIQKLLSGSDVKIQEADMGQVALDLLEAQQFDCMILDLTLPDMSGFEVLTKMNRLETINKCPVIVYTGRDLTSEENMQLLKFADSVIVKGVKSPERLLDETALFLHRVVADMPKEKQQTIEQLYNKEGLLKDKKVLIVDDDMRNSFALSKLLAEKGLITKIAQNGQKALDILAEEPDFDIVLMDIMMPVMDGYEATKRIRELPNFQTLPILALTAKAMMGDREKILAIGANDYLPKPIDVDRLFSMLRVWLYR